jgi:hypothetical protein
MLDLLLIALLLANDHISRVADLGRCLLLEQLLLFHDLILLRDKFRDSCVSLAVPLCLERLEVGLVGNLEVRELLFELEDIGLVALVLGGQLVFEIVRLLLNGRVKQVLRRCLPVLLELLNVLLMLI